MLKQTHGEPRLLGFRVHRLRSSCADVYQLTTFCEPMLPLASVARLPQGHALNVLRSYLKTAQVLTLRYGANFRVSSRSLGFRDTSLCRPMLWIASSAHSFEPVFTPSSEFKNIQQAINDILQLVRQRAPDFPPELEAALLREHGYAAVLRTIERWPCSDGTHESSFVIFDEESQH
jgi:hypothetical protein